MFEGLCSSVSNTSAFWLQHPEFKSVLQRASLQLMWASIHIDPTAVDSVMNAIVGIGSQWGGTADTQIQVHWNETHYLPINDCLG